MKNALFAATVLAAVASCRTEERSRPPEPAEAACSAQSALERLDTRLPVPLLPMMANHQKQMMRDHLVVVGDIVTALGREDFATIERAARKSGYSEQMGATCSHMGAGAPGFTEQAIAFHKTADAIADAARSHDRDGVVRSLGEALGTCTGCHATFRQQVVDEKGFARAAAAGSAGH